MKLKVPFLMYCSAPRGSGKTYFVVQQLVNPDLYFQEFDKVFLFTPSIGDDDVYNILQLPPKQIFTEFDEKKVMKLVEKKKDDDQWLFIFDDMIGDNDFKNAKFMRLLAYNGRHMGISVIITSQKSTAGNTAIRTNADACVIWRPRSNNEIEALYRDNAINAMRKREFEEMIMKNTEEKYSFLYINYQTNEVYRNYEKISVRNNIEDAKQ
jgi:NhaP-type Na+/H+ and K+/H+ antiporter